MSEMNVQTWECGAENAGDVIATLEGTTLTISGKGKMENYYEFSYGKLDTNEVKINYYKEYLLGYGKIGIKDYNDCYYSNGMQKYTDLYYIERQPAFIQLKAELDKNQGLREKWEQEYRKELEKLNEKRYETVTKKVSIKTPWYGKSITKIVIEEGVESIGDFAFKSCYGIQEIVFHNKLIEIGHRAFEDCINLKRIINYNPVPQILNWYDKNPFDVLERGTSSQRIKIPFLCVPLNSMKLYENAPVWKKFNYTKPIKESHEDNSPEWLKAEIEKKKEEIEVLNCKLLLLKGIEGNPKHVAQFMSLFNQRDGLKYLTHDFDESGEFDMDSFLTEIRKVCVENFGQLEIPKSLTELFNNFVNEKNPKWTAFDNQFNAKEITSGWSSSEWEEAKVSKLHPVKYPKFAEIIKDFKRTTRIESPNLEKLINKIFDDGNFEIDIKKDLRKADFYTHVGEFKSALETIFEEIQKRSDSDEKKKVTVEYNRSTDDDFFVCKLKITHHNSYPTKEEDVLLKEWLSLEKGSMGKIAERLQGYCHWSVVTKIEDKPLKVNILREKETPTQEDIDASEVDGFTHILTYYYH